MTVAILCGGKSSRMGKDKAALFWEGKTFLERLVSEFSEADDCDEILICGKAEGDQGQNFGGKSKGFQDKNCGSKIKFIQDQNFGVKARFVPDQNSEKGPLEGLRGALSEAKSDLVFVCAVDMPFAAKEIPSYLKEFVCSDYDCYVPLAAGRPEPLCALYKKSALPAVEEQLAAGELKLSRLFEKVPTKFVAVEKSSLSKKLFANVNAPQDFLALLKPFVFCVCGIKNSGKTRMVLSLLSAAQSKGYKCAVVKRDGHDVFSDAPGTDTFKFSQAGALGTAVFSDKRFMLCAPTETFCKTESGGSATETACMAKTAAAQELVEELTARCPGLDFVIIEGLKDSALPKIEVLRQGISERPSCNKQNLICLASDFALGGADCDVPVMDSSDAEGIFSLVEKYFLQGITDEACSN